MNSYTATAFISNVSKSSSAPSILYVFVPMIFGIAVDILFTQVMGSQFCTLNKTEYTCNIHGFKCEQWQREAVRFILQLGLIMCLLILFQTYNNSLVFPMYNSLFGVIGLILMFIVQVDLFSDFRRLCNGLVFSIKHN